MSNEVALASLFTAAKLNDTLKRATDFILAGYALRYPDMIPPLPSLDALAKTNAEGTKDSAVMRTALDSLGKVDWVAHGRVSESEIDPAALEQERSRLLALERLLLQSICFNFQLRSQRILSGVVKLARLWSVPKQLSALAWRIACDCHRTYAPIVYPPQTIAVAAIYLAVCLQNAKPCAALPQSEVDRLFATLRGPGAAEWESLLNSNVGDATRTSQRAKNKVLTLRRGAHRSRSLHARCVDGGVRAAESATWNEARYAGRFAFRRDTTALTTTLHRAPTAARPATLGFHSRWRVARFRSCAGQSAFVRSNRPQTPRAGEWRVAAQGLCTTGCT